MKIIKIENKPDDFFPRIIIQILGLKFVFANKNIYYKKFQIFHKYDKPAAVIFDHVWGGGTETFFYNFIESILNPVNRIQYHPKYNLYKISILYKGLTSIFYEKDIEHLFKILKQVEISEIVVNNLVGYTCTKDVLRNIKELAGAKNIKTTCMLHDFYPIYPVHTLTTKDNEYCNLNFDRTYCNICAQDNKHPAIEISATYKNFDICEWRDMWRDFLSSMDEVRTFCPSAKNILLRVYPEISSKITVVPHKVKPFIQKDKIHVGILGTLGKTKGLNVISDFLKYLDENNINNIQLYIIGDFQSNIKNKKMTILGSYKRKNLPEILLKNNIDIVFIPSIWPETFSYTTAEAISFNYPVACFDIGGQADQVRNYKKGIILKSPQDITDIYNSIINFKREIENQIPLH